MLGLQLAVWGLPGLRAQTTAPAITSQPAERVANVGDSVVYSVTATGSGVSYQWLRNGIALPGATGASLSLANVQVADGGRYQVLVSNATGTVASDAVLLRGVNPPPVLTSPPSGPTANNGAPATAGSPASFSISATGGAALQYQWRRNGFPIDGATNATVTWPSVSRSDADVYDVRVNDGLSVTYSDPVRLFVQPSATPPALGIDPSFAPTFEVEGGAVARLRRTANGKILVAGTFSHFDGATQPNLARLNADATLDRTFVGSNFDGPVLDVAAQPDGRLIVVGSFTHVDALTRAGLVRLNADGTPDSSFTPAVLSIQSLAAMLVQDDGKIILAGNLTVSAGTARVSNLVRLVADGSLDATYAPSVNAPIRSVALQPDGRLLAAGAFTSIAGTPHAYLARLLSDGTYDATFNPGTGPSAAANLVKANADGTVLVGGGFSSFNGATAPGLVRLRADGSRDASFIGASVTAFGTSGTPPPPDGSVVDLAVVNDGKIIVVGSFQHIDNEFIHPPYGFARLNADGTRDLGFAPDGIIAGGVTNVLVLADGRLLLGGDFRKLTFAKAPGGVAGFDSAGKRDASITGTFNPASMNALALASRGKVLVAGNFTRVNGVARAALARLNPDGSLDTSLNALPNDAVYDVAVQGDGKILITGAFSAVAGVPRTYLARLNADGSLDTGFALVPGGVSGAFGGDVRAVPLSGGRVLLAGNGVDSYYINREYFARLNLDGSLDSRFVPFTPGSSAARFVLSAFAVLPDARVIYANDGANGLSAPIPPVIGRILPDGPTDSTFTPGSAGRGTGIETAAILPDGKILVGGNFTTFNNVSRNRIARLLANGDVDPSWSSSQTSTVLVSRLLPARDGQAYVFRTSGSNTFGTMSQSLPTRMAADGSNDAGFALTFTTGDSVGPTLLLDDGNLLLAGGTFRDTAGAGARIGLVRTRALSGAFLLSSSGPTTISAGTTLTLSAIAGGDAGATYQWYKDGKPIDGAQRTTYTLPGAQSSDAGVYSMVVSVAGGSVGSGPIPVTINESVPVFANASGALAGSSSPLKVGTRYALTAPGLAAGTTPLTYQWSRDGVAIPGETGTALFRAGWSLADAGSYTVAVTNSQGSVVSQPFQQNVADTPNWDWASPLPQGNSLGAVGYANDRFFATGAVGTFLDSADGVQWSAHRLPTSSTLGPLLFGNGTYVILAQFGGIFTSGDASQWTARESGLVDGRSLSNVVFGGGRFVAVGSLGAVCTSADGVKWTLGSLPVADSGASVGYGGGQFLVVTSAGRVFASNDGTTWTSRAQLPENAAYVAYGAGLFVTASLQSQTIFTSPDGVTWTRRPSNASTAASVLNVVYADGFIVPIATSTGRYLTSTDGLTWSEKSFSTSLTTAFYQMTRHGLVQVVAASAPDLLLFSVDGGNLARVAPAEGRAFRAIATDGITAVAVGSSTVPVGPPQASLIRATYDGKTWFDRTVSFAVGLNDVTYAGGALHQFIAVGEGGTILTSPDGVTWNRQTSPATATLRGVKFNQDRVFVSGDGTMLTSTDGMSWTRLTVPTSTQLYQTARGNGAYVAVGASGTVLRSSDGVTWIGSSTASFGNLLDVIFAAGKFVAIGSAGQIVTSPDGVTWTPQKSNAAALTRLVYTGGQFLALGVGASYFLSSDGLTWTAAQHGGATALVDACEFANGVIGVGALGTIMRLQFRAPVGTTLPVITAQAANQSARVGDGVVLSVAGSGSPVPVYQWLRNGAPVAGATQSTLSLSSAQLSDAGSYVCVVTTPAGATTSAAATVVVRPAAQLSNLSVRANLGAAQTLNVGFTVGGNGGSQWILVRAAGPALTPLGVNGAMADPKLALYARGNLIAQNDDWGGTTSNLDFARVGAFAFPVGGKDAAWMGPLADGVTAVASGPGAGTVLVECYDTGLTPTNTARLTNLSARSRVGTGGDVLIAGLAVTGSSGLRVLIRAIGPGLVPFGVSGTLADPKLEVYDSNGVKLEENDNWPGSLAATFASVGAFALTPGSADAALVMNLPAPGTYTVQVSGVGGTIGEALVEVYEMP